MLRDSKGRFVKAPAPPAPAIDGDRIARELGRAYNRGDFAFIKGKVNRFLELNQPTTPLEKVVFATLQAWAR